MCHNNGGSSGVLFLPSAVGTLQSPTAAPRGHHAAGLTLDHLSIHKLWQILKVYRHFKRNDQISPKGWNYRHYAEGVVRMSLPHSHKQQYSNMTVINTCCEDIMTFYIFTIWIVICFTMLGISSMETCKCKANKLGLGTHDYPRHTDGFWDTVIICKWVHYMIKDKHVCE